MPSCAGLLGRNEQYHVAANKRGAELSRHVAFNALFGVVEYAVDVNVKRAERSDKLLAVLQLDHDLAVTRAVQCIQWS